MQEHDPSREENVPFCSLPRVQQTPEGRAADSGAYAGLHSVLSSRGLSCESDVYSQDWYHRVAWKLRANSLKIFGGRPDVDAHCEGYTANVEDPKARSIRENTE